MSDRTSYFLVASTTGHNHRKSIPLVGFGRALAVAFLIHDYDCIGNSGNNMGYVIKEKYAEIVKIDPGEALSFAEDMSGAKELENPPDQKQVIIGTSGGQIHFTDLNKQDQQEFIQTLEEVLNFPDCYLKMATKRFLAPDEKFKTILDKLIERKHKLLGAFYEDLKPQLLQQLQQTESEQVQKGIESWDNPKKLSLPQFDETQSKLTDKISLLEATKACYHSKEVIIFQVPHATSSFIGRQTELEEMKNIFEKNNESLTVLQGSARRS